jgi:monofunctional biosynthetic peptidoglycan transglycosylase
MNVIETGDGIFGIETASKKYFNKSAISLTRHEAALIAASLPNPKRFTVKPAGPYVSSRALWVIRQMNNLDGDLDIQKILK